MGSYWHRPFIRVAKGRVATSGRGTNRGNSGDLTQVKLLLHGEGADNSTTFTDSSVSARTVSANGVVRVDTAFFKFGSSSIEYPGAGAYLSCADSPDFDFVSGDFTIETWVRPNLDGSGATFMGIAAKRAGGAALGPFLLMVSGNGILYGRSNLGGAGWDVNLSTAIGTIPSGVWTHIAYVRAGNVWSLYAGGARVATATVSGTVMTNTTLVTLGVAGTNGEFQLIGHLDEVRITKGLAQYTGATYTVPTGAF